MSRRYLIDGYNLLHAVGLPARLGKLTLHHARQRLIDLIHDRHPKDSITIVFDARQSPPGAKREQTQQGIHIIFAHGSADDLIREIVAHDSAPRSLCVVTGDREVQENARRRGARVMDALPFLDALAPAPPETTTPEKPTAASAADLQTWLDAFGSIDSDADVQRMQHIDPMNPDPDKVKKHRSRRQTDVDD